VSGSEIRRIYWQIFLILIGLLALGLVLWACGELLSPEEWWGLWNDFLEKIGRCPIGFVCALGFFPAIGIPVSPFYLLCGGVYGFPKGLLLCALGLGINLTVTYLLGHYGLPAVWRALNKKRHGFGWQARTRRGALRWILLVRLMPIPFFAQNYLLCSVRGIGFVLYWTLSWIIQMGWACAFVLGGKDWVRGHWGMEGILGVLLVSWAVRSGRRRIKNLQGDVREYTPEMEER
jgi:uncharacterized membrane protein YdjX (TVP38/TMEM64 family)